MMMTSSQMPLAAGKPEHRYSSHRRRWHSYTGAVSATDRTDIPSQLDR